MRGLQGAFEARLFDSVSNVIAARADVRPDSDDDISIHPSETFSKVAWAFKSVQGLEYAKEFHECSAPELLEVCSKFFYKIQELQQQLKAAELKAERLDGEIKALMSPALQLLA
jgi:hypothetical protein